VTPLAELSLVETLGLKAHPHRLGGLAALQGCLTALQVVPQEQAPEQVLFLNRKRVPCRRICCWSSPRRCCRPSR